MCKRILWIPKLSSFLNSYPKHLDLYRQKSCFPIKDERQFFWLLKDILPCNFCAREFLEFQKNQFFLSSYPIGTFTFSDKKLYFAIRGERQFFWLLKDILPCNFLCKRILWISKLSFFSEFISQAPLPLATKILLSYQRWKTIFLTYKRHSTL